MSLVASLTRRAPPAAALVVHRLCARAAVPTHPLSTHRSAPAGPRCLAVPPRAATNLDDLWPRARRAPQAKSETRAAAPRARLVQTMASTGAGYDLSPTTFSPDGRIFQVEYATKAVENSGTVVGIRCADGVVLGVEKVMLSKMLLPSSNRRVAAVAPTPAWRRPEVRRTAARSSRARGTSATRMMTRMGLRSRRPY